MNIIIILCALLPLVHSRIPTWSIVNVSFVFDLFPRKQLKTKTFRIIFTEIFLVKDHMMLQAPSKHVSVENKILINIFVYLKNPFLVDGGVLTSLQDLISNDQSHYDDDSKKADQFHFGKMAGLKNNYRRKC